MNTKRIPPHSRPYDNVLQVVGWTPLIRLNQVVGDTRTPVYGKAEFMNPAGSVKDRIGIAMIEAAEEAGDLKPGGVIVEGTAGNTGLALAMAAAIKGYSCIFTMPDKFSQEKIRLMKAFGAEVIITPTEVPRDHPDHYLNVAARIVEETPNAFMADQFFNPANPEAHYRTTGAEIWQQTDGNVTHFVAAAGTGGTITGVARYLKEKNPDIKVIAGDPHGSVLAHQWRTGEPGPHAPYKVEGIGNSFLPGTFDLNLIDDFHTIADRESLNMARRLTREEGLFVGGSSGLITCVAVNLARELDDPDALIVCILPSTGERYLSKIYNDEWMRENRLLITDNVTARQVIKEKPAEVPMLISIKPDTDARTALEMMEKHSVSQLPVLSDDECVGLVSESNLMARIVEKPDLIDGSVEPLMEPAIPSVDGDADLDTVTKHLVQGHSAVLVRQGGVPAGIVTRFDVVQYLTGFGP